MGAQEKKKEAVIEKYGDKKVKLPCAVLLWSSLSSNSHQTSAQKSCNDKMIAFKVRFEQLDGAQGENKELRNKLFNVSNVRGKYPQIFIQNEKEELEYIGMDDAFQQIVDSEAVAKVFASCIN